ncbi:MAG: hypothetical protein WBO38_03855 [Chitinophagaceae bacterium]
MTKYLILAIVLTWNLPDMQWSHQNDYAPFTSLSFQRHKEPKFPGRVISLDGTINNNKVLLNWKVEENEAVYMFEVEKSMDGKNFTTAAIVFGTDKSETEEYRFFEKASKPKSVYRIKLINKQRQVAYSKIITVSPAS